MLRKFKKEIFHNYNNQIRKLMNYYQNKKTFLL